MDRRDALKMMSTGTVAGVGAMLLPSITGLKLAAAEEKPAALNSPYKLKPLPFNPTKLKGMSEKLITSHYENNYGGAVKKLAQAEAQLFEMKSDAPAYLVTGLQSSAHAFRNSMILHEMYFYNLGGNGKASGRIQKLIAETFGSFGHWEEMFRAAGAGLAGGSGWVILTYDFHDKKPVITTTQHNNQAHALGVPILLMDMYEHAYAIDFGAAAPKYIDAYFQNINWDEVNRRLELAEASNLKNL